MVYDPAEDSYLLEREVKKYATLKVLDMGTGSGIQAEAAAEKDEVEFSIGIDIDKEAVNYCRLKANKKIQFLESDLFTIFVKNRYPELTNYKIRKFLSSGNIKFNTIIFNPPYLPDEKKIFDIALDGGKYGHETLQRFLEQAQNYMAPDAIILILFSSLTNKKRVDKIIKQLGYKAEQLSSIKLSFEELYCYKLTSELNFLAKGKRGVVFVTKDKKIAIKRKNPQSDAQNKIENEARFLKLLNKHDIGPRFISSGKDYLSYKFVDGEFILDYFEKASKKEILHIVQEILKQCYTLDKLKMNKEEMHHPLKHVLITKKGPVMIDFERSKYTEKPKNVTQFCQFLRNPNLKNLFDKKGIPSEVGILNLAAAYSKERTEKSFNTLLNLFKQ